jgi:hypothetical protein
VEVQSNWLGIPQSEKLLKWVLGSELEPNLTEGIENGLWALPTLLANYFAIELSYPHPWRIVWGCWVFSYGRRYANEAQPNLQI